MDTEAAAARRGAGGVLWTLCAAHLAGLETRGASPWLVNAFETVVALPAVHAKGAVAPGYAFLPLAGDLLAAEPGRAPRIVGAGGGAIGLGIPLAAASAGEAAGAAPADAAALSQASFIAPGIADQSLAIVAAAVLSLGAVGRPFATTCALAQVTNIALILAVLTTLAPDVLLAGEWRLLVLAGLNRAVLFGLGAIPVDLDGAVSSFAASVQFGRRASHLALQAAPGRKQDHAQQERWEGGLF